MRLGVLFTRNHLHRSKHQGRLAVEVSVWTEGKYWTALCERSVRSKFSAGWKSVRYPVCYTAVSSAVTQRSSTQRALRDDTKNGCVTDYLLSCECEDGPTRLSSFVGGKLKLCLKVQLLIHTERRESLIFFISFGCVANNFIFFSRTWLFGF